MKHESQPDITYAQSVLYVSIQDEFDVSAAFIGRYYGMSKKYVGNIIRCRRALIEPIVKAWADPTHKHHKLCAHNTLNKLAALSQASQEILWKAMCLSNIKTGECKMKCDAETNMEKAKDKANEAMRLMRESARRWSIERSAESAQAYMEAKKLLEVAGQETAKAYLALKETKKASGK